MDYTLREVHGQPILQLDPGHLPIASEQAILDVIAQCGELGCARLLIPASVMDPAFFDLKSGLAGLVLLKLSTYRVQTALVCPPETLLKERFREFMQETNRGNVFRIFPDTDAALRWLSPAPDPA